MQTRKWQDKDGNDRWSTEVVLQGFNGNLTMLDGRGEGGGQSEYSRVGNPAGRPNPVAVPILASPARVSAAVAVIWTTRFRSRPCSIGETDFLAGLVARNCELVGIWISIGRWSAVCRTMLKCCAARLVLNLRF